MTATHLQPVTLAEVRAELDAERPRSGVVSPRAKGEIELTLGRWWDIATGDRPRWARERRLIAALAEPILASLKYRGGMLRQAWMTMFVAVKKEAVDDVLGIIKTNCVSDVSVEAGAQAQPIQATLSSAQAKVGGAVAFVWDLDKFEVY